MTEDVFWQLISLLNREASDEDEALKPMLGALSQMEPEAICGFEDLLTEKLYALDTREHCAAFYADHQDRTRPLHNMVSPDEFLYARCAVVMRGRASYERILKTPCLFPLKIWFEAVLYLASSAYEARTGQEWSHSSPLSCETFSNKAGWDEHPPPADS